MPQFSKKSQERLSSCHPYLQEICNELIKEVDIIVLCGHRTEEEQNDAYNKGTSKLKWPDSKHNSLPSKAVDIAPYPLDWNDIEGFKQLAGRVFTIADRLGIKIEWGGSWSKFRDYPHFQLVD